MNSTPNFFIKLHQWAKRQDENYTTEAFVYLLQHLRYQDNELFLNLVSKITNGLIDLTQPAKNIRISTQQHQENTIQDIHIETPNQLVFIEVKLDSPLTRKQVIAYLTLLEEKNLKPEDKLLVCLTRYPVSANITDGAYALRWYQIAEWLEKDMLQTQDTASLFVISNFISFLEYQRATLPKVSSSISKGLAEYRKTIPSEKSILNKRFRNPDKLLLAKELKPLYDLMLLIFEATKNFVDEKSIKFDTSNNKKGEGSISYNISNGEYFVWLKYKQPEILYVTTYNRVSNEKQNNLQLGEIVYEYNRYRWKNKINLMANGFFDLDKREQIKFLSSTIKDNLAFAKSVTKPIR